MGNYITDISSFVLKLSILIFINYKVNTDQLKRFIKEKFLEAFSNFNITHLACFVSYFIVLILSLFDSFVYTLQFTLWNFLKYIVVLIANLALIALFYNQFNRELRQRSLYEDARKYAICSLLNELLFYGIKIWRWTYVTNKINEKTNACINFAINNRKIFRNQQVDNNLSNKVLTI
jgi:hypothetical protein